MEITDFKKSDKIKIVDVGKIRQGEMMWENGDIVEIKNIETGGEGYNRLDVWNKEKYLSEYIYPDEFIGIQKIQG